MHFETHAHIADAKPRESGFSLLELAVVVVVAGIIFALSVPAYHDFRESSALKSAKDNIIGQLRLAREKAIATRVQQEVRFVGSYSESEFQNASGTVITPPWQLPKGISYCLSTGTKSRYRMQPSGRCLDSGMVIVQDTRGNRDTVIVMTSGMVLGR